MATLQPLKTNLAMAICLCALAPVTAQSNEPTNAVAWLTGCWSAEGKETGTGETWIAPAGGSMLGVSRTVREGKTVSFEFMQIRTDKDAKLVFIALPSGQRETAFTAITIEADQVVFENPTHDFPQKISYRKTGAETMIARIEGAHQGTARSINFPMRRSSCELPK